jgi:hypothetical protein
MSRLIYLLMLVSCSTLAAPPVIPPGGLTPAQMIAVRQGVDINIRHTAAQNVTGARGDEYSAMNPGSGQARSIFNSTVMNSLNLHNAQPNVGPNAALNEFSKAYAEQGIATSLAPMETPQPFASKVAKSQLMGMPFLKKDLSSGQSNLIFWMPSMHVPVDIILLDSSRHE